MFNLCKFLFGQFLVCIVVVKEVDYVFLICFFCFFEMFIIFKVEDVIVVRIKVFCNDRWELEYYSIFVDKVNEVELMVYDKFGEYVVFIGFFWVRIFDIVEEMCWKKIEVEIIVQGWVFVD